MKDGGPAFPGIKIEQRGDPCYVKPTRVYYRGMSLRDWFAGMAEIGILASRDERGRGGFTELGSDEIAQRAFTQANAMIARREETKEI